MFASSLYPPSSLVNPGNAEYVCEFFISTLLSMVTSTESVRVGNPDGQSGEGLVYMVISEIPVCFSFLIF